MTILNKSVKRETSAVYRKRPIIIQLEPPSIIRLKEKGRRTWYETSVEAVYCLAAKNHAKKILEERRKRKEERNNA